VSITHKTGKLTADVVIRFCIWRFSSRRPRGRLACSFVATKQAECVPPRRKIETIRLSVFRSRDDRCINKSAIFMRLLASTAAATHISNRSRPSQAALHAATANNTERCAPRCRRESVGVLELPALLICLRSGVLVAAALWDAHHLDAILFARRHVVLAEDPRSPPYNRERGEGLLVVFSESNDVRSSTGFPSSTSYCVIKPRALSARNTCDRTRIGVCTLPRLMRSVWGSKIE